MLNKAPHSIRYKLLLSISLSLILLTGCNESSNNSSDNQKVVNKPVASGKFIASYESATTTATQREEKLWRDNKLLEDFVEDMNQFVNIPVDVKVIAKECDEANAFYDPETHSIEMCYELAAHERQMFTDAGDTLTEIEEQLYQSAVGTLYHEAGHALIAELDLKYTGREEDVADQLAAYILTTNDEDKEYLLTVADTYSLAARDTSRLEDLLFYGRHSLDAQRAVNFLCYVYGSDPDSFEDLIADDLLHEDRAPDCEDEYKHLVAAWDQLLEPHLKD